MKPFTICVGAAILWAVVAPVVYLLRDMGDEQSRRLRSVAHEIEGVPGMSRAACGQTNEVDFTVVDEQCATLAASVRRLAEVEDERQARAARAMGLSSAVIVLTTLAAAHAVRRPRSILG